MLKIWLSSNSLLKRKLNVPLFNLNLLNFISDLPNELKHYDSNSESTLPSKQRNLLPGSILDRCHEDVSVYSPYHQPSYNIAAYVNKSSTLQKLVDLGVDLSKIEKTKGASEVILRLDFERNIAPYIRFLFESGVTAGSLGNFITRNPFIFNEDIDNLLIRINYLYSKKFTEENVSRIISKNPQWLSHKTQDIDGRLGFFQQKFTLIGDEVRFLTVKRPQIITYNLRHIEETHFSVKEEMGFLASEIKQILLNKPKIFTICRRMLIERFSYLHSVMALPQSLIASQPGALLCRIHKIKERHGFLKSLGKAQYDPSQPGYVSVTTLVSGTDADFCKNVANTAVSTYNIYLKTL